MKKFFIMFCLLINSLHLYAMEQSEPIKKTEEKKVSQPKDLTEQVTEKIASHIEYLLEQGSLANMWNITKEFLSIYENEGSTTAYMFIRENFPFFYKKFHEIIERKDFGNPIMDIPLISLLLRPLPWDRQLEIFSYLLNKQAEQPIWKEDNHTTPTFKIQSLSKKIGNLRIYLEWLLAHISQKDQERDLIILLINNEKKFYSIPIIAEIADQISSSEQLPENYQKVIEKLVATLPDNYKRDALYYLLFEIGVTEPGNYLEHDLKTLNLLLSLGLNPSNEDNQGKSIINYINEWLQQENLGGYPVQKDSLKRALDIINKHSIEKK